jgi:hypothetical protein
LVNTYRTYASDPTSTDAEGQIWYNTTSGTFKTALGSFGACGSSGGNLNTARLGGGGVGTQTAALGFGGYVSAPVGNTTATESYNGSAWTTLPYNGWIRMTIWMCWYTNSCFVFWWIWSKSVTYYTNL